MPYFGLLDMSSHTKEEENRETGKDVIGDVADKKEEPINEQHLDHGDSLNRQHMEEDNRLPSEQNVDNHPPPSPKLETTPAIDNENMTFESTSNQGDPPSVPSDNHQHLVEPDPAAVKAETSEIPGSDAGANHGTTISVTSQVTAEPGTDAEIQACQVPESKMHGVDSGPAKNDEPKPEPEAELAIPCPASSGVAAKNENGKALRNGMNKAEMPKATNNGNLHSKQFFLWDENQMSEVSESGTEDEQSAFMRELENFFRERCMEFKPPKFYGEGLNCLKLWRAVMRLGGYDKVTSCKLWRQVGESFKPPKTCTTVSWTFRGFYEKALLDYERHTTPGGELNMPMSTPEPMSVDNQASGSGRARRDAAARAMQGWHSQRLLGNGEVSDPIIKDKNSVSLQKRENKLKSLGLLKRKKLPYIEHAAKAARTKASKPQLDTTVVDIGPPADWVKINIQRTKECFEVYALVPGLLREEVRVQSDPAGRLVISGEPEHPDNPWGVTAFKKVVSLPARIDPHQTSAVVTLHGQLFVRVPFEQSE